MNKTTILLAGLAVLCAAPATAETMSIPVSFAGLDLTSASGKAILDRRINNAVRTICGIPDASDLNAVRENRRCATDTMNRTQPRVSIAVAASKPSVQVATAR